MSVSRLQLFGQRCSGTNYLERLIAENIDDVSIVTDFGYKHFTPQIQSSSPNDCLFIILYRHPIDWITSFYRTPWHAPLTLKNLNFSDFIRQEWFSVWDKHAGVTKHDPRWGHEMMFDRDPGTGKRFGNVIEMRTAKIQSWEALRQDSYNAVYLRYEDAVENPSGVIERIAFALNATESRPVAKVNSYKGGGRWYQGLGERLRRKRKPEVSREDMAFILRSLDRGLERSIGYDIPSETQCGGSAAKGEAGQNIGTSNTSC
ncbi:MAG: hypothetical protein V7700_17435 [Halioglobus sp.]